MSIHNLIPKHLPTLTLVVLITSLFWSTSPSTAWAQIADNPLKAINIETPRETITSYLGAMNDYMQGLKSGDPQKKMRLHDATRCLNLTQTNISPQSKQAGIKAQLLKEILDRIIFIDVSTVPHTTNIPYWRIDGTDITIRKIDSGPQKGQYLFSANTVNRLEEFYARVQHLKYIEGLPGGGFQLPLIQRYLPTWAQEQFLGKHKNIGLITLSTLLFALFLNFIVRIVLHLLTHSMKTESLRRHFFSALNPTVGWVFASGFLLLIVESLKQSGFFYTFLHGLGQVLFSSALVWTAYRLTSVASLSLQLFVKNTKIEIDTQIITLMSKLLKIGVVIIGALITLQNLGVNVLSLLAGLGIGGLTLALAAKDTAANFFGSLMIFIDQPFKVGDWIVTSQGEGTVEEIGFRSTRLRTFYSSIISVPNALIASEEIDNMGRRQARRVKTELALTFDTRPEKIKAFIDEIKTLLKNHPSVQKHTYHVVFNNYASSSLNILLYFFLNVENWSQELNTKEEIFLRIYDIADKLQVNFAFPTQTLHLEPTNPLPAIDKI